MKLDTLFRFLRTLRFLRPSQVMWRLRYLGQRRFPVLAGQWKPSNKLAYHVRGDFPPLLLPELTDTQRETIFLLLQGRLRLLNVEKELTPDGPDWHLGPRTIGRLWTATLHYHEWLTLLAMWAASNDDQTHALFQLFKAYVSHWLCHCDLEREGTRDLAWNAYTIATRIPNWIRCFFLFPKREWDGHQEFQELYVKSLWKQASYLHDHVEYDLRANHLLRDAVGLAWAGRFFDTRQSRKWGAKAEQITWQQIHEQILPDGGHFERSPMYHIQVMEDLFSLAHVLEDKTIQKHALDAWRRMAECIFWLRHPDGGIPLFNDAALNGSPSPLKVLRLGYRMGWWKDIPIPTGGKLFQDFGLFVWHGDPWTVFFDIGPVGVDYQPGHGHADTLTVEVSFSGERLWVDPGTWGYDLDDRRKYDRSTEAHNTVCVDREDSSEVWHIFRCGRRARPSVHGITIEDKGFHISASHDGYRHLPGSPRPIREINLDRQGYLMIKDRCEGQGVHHLTGGWLMAPGWTAQACEGGWRVHHPKAGTVRVRVYGPGSLNLHQVSRWYHPEFGKELVTSRLEWAITTRLPVEIVTVHESE